MREILKGISEKAILLGDFKFTDEQVNTKWLGYPAADSTQIKETEARLGVELPEDYMEFLKITNGFPQYNQIVSSFMPVEKIDFLKVYDPFLIEIWQKHDELKDVAKGLEASILIGGLNEEQCSLLIPPNANSGKWGYWKFASWHPGEVPYNSLKEYLMSELEFMNEEVGNSGTNK
jgi:hypothetical protein